MDNNFSKFLSKGFNRQHSSEADYENGGKEILIIQIIMRRKKQ